MNVEVFQSELLSWVEQNRRNFPWRQTEDPYKTLIAEVLLQRTLAQKVVPIYDQFINQYSSPEELAEANVDELAQVLNPLGLQNRRARALIEIGRRLSGPTIPKNEEKLLELPFIGRYAANAILCFAFGEARAVVDVNVLRIYCRVFGFNWDNDQDDHAWEIAQELLPNDNAQEYNLALLDLGATVCTANNPSCSECPISKYCDYFQKEKM